MLRWHIRPVKLRKWFPPHDGLAACVARLCILREDFLLESQGVYSEEIKALDEHSDKWRRMYFLRNSIRTLSEIRGAIETLQRQAEFKRILAAQPKARQNRFRKLIKEFTKAHRVVKEIRNSLGGHVQHKAVQKALDGMSFDQWGFLEVGRILKETHYKFAGELVATIMVGGAPENLQMSKLENDFKLIAELFPVLPLMDEVVDMYAEARGLL